MPAPPKSTNTDALQPNIVVLEEYDALAAAFSSALKKFAPHHRAVVARSIKELEKLAGDLAPELFIFDVDPPWAGITKCLERLRDSHPKARALVIGTAIPSDIASDRGLSGALQFVEKPFDLSTFGAAVQALLGPWRESQFRGTLRALSTLDVVLLHCSAGANVVVEVQSRSRTGQIQINAGQISHAETRKLKGEDALVQILEWSKSQFSERKLTRSQARSIGANWPAVIVEFLRESRSEIPESPQREVEIPKPKTGKKIVVIDDTEMLLIFVEDVLATAEPNLQITTAQSGSDGLREIVRAKPDLVLLDYSLPDFNGDEVCRALLENKETENVPVLMMSGHVAQMSTTAARFGNVVATIEKPFLSDALIDLVRRTLAGERQVVRKPVAELERKKIIAETRPAPVPAIAPPQPSPPQPAAPPPPQPPQRPTPPPAPPPRQDIAPPAKIAREPVRIPIEPRAEVRKPVESSPAIRVAPMDGSGAVLGLFLEVLSMQLTSQLQMGAIRARPASLMASLRLQSATARSAIPAETAFQIGPAHFSSEGRISQLRMLPTTKPLQPAQMRSAFEIGGVAVIPNETRARVQLTPAGTTPMTMELLAHLELNAVELTPNFQVAQLILNWPTSAVRVTLNPKAPEQTAAQFQMRVEKLDNSGRIAEVVLSPIR
ncbi:MAG TPA: response regulator [Chthoniobacterales bacterium]|nr:response regulator [Chthoniobacterales bacterium]